MKKITLLVLLVMFLGCDTPTIITPLPVDTTKSNQPKLPINGFYYYSGEFWLDCAGKTVNNAVIRSTVALDGNWTRDGVTGGYFHISEATTDTAYTLLSDGTVNPSCGY